MVSFFLVLCYNYYGDNMNSDYTIINISNIDDIKKIKSNTKYINIDLNKVSNEVIDFFLLNGVNYSYSDIIDDRQGFIYADFNMFKYGESLIDNIVDNMPCDLTELEKVRYIYISLGKILYIDINAMNEKNDTISFDRISTMNNIWGALSRRKINDSIVSKIFMYICSRLGIRCELVNNSIKGSIANRVFIDDNYIVVDLFNDIHNIQGKFMTHYFDKYNDNLKMDIKINYIVDNYTNYKLDEIFSTFDYNVNNILYNILSITSNIINISDIGSYELFKIYSFIFDKYIPNNNIIINNLYVYKKFEEKEHFTLFCSDDKYYSYNYIKKCFIDVDAYMLNDNINKNKIGIYDDEKFKMMEERIVL